jgi:hypothetical protein
MLPVAMALIVISRYLFRQPYPELRTAMYWLPLLGLASMSLVQRLAHGPRLERILSAPLAAILALFAVQFATQFNTRYFSEWSYCAAGKDIMRIVRAGRPDHDARRVRIGATWQLSPVIDFYRVAWRLDWIDPVSRASPDNQFDYYVLLYGDTALVERRGLKTLLKDSLSGAVLARRPDL